MWTSANTSSRKASRQKRLWTPLSQRRARGSKWSSTRSMTSRKRSPCRRLRCPSPRGVAWTHRNSAAPQRSRPPHQPCCQNRQRTTIGAARMRRRWPCQKLQERRRSVIAWRKGAKPRSSRGLRTLRTTLRTTLRARHGRGRSPKIIQGRRERRRRRRNQSRHRRNHHWSGRSFWPLRRWTRLTFCPAAGAPGLPTQSTRHLASPPGTTRRAQRESQNA
mmetsp:Transcript_3070/g.8383  ORF Transcript_3070/g.8383 Transcript_3070/m.8383 type:complete len:219 (-) Transcript_3070:561-1217(-)